MLNMRILILYGSQTGTAQDVAEFLWRESKKCQFQGPVLPMDDFPITQLIYEQLVIFVASTTGDGTEPDNMRKSWKFLLRDKLPKDSLKNMQFACLGLGDSSYSKFNYAAKKLYKRLLQLGAEPIISLGLCDDQHDYGYYAEALTWSKELWGKLEKMFHLKMQAETNEAANFKWKCEVLTEPQQDIADTEENNILKPFWNKVPCWRFKLLENVRTTHEDHFQDVRLLQFAIPEEGVKWLPGAALQVQPHNSLQQVETFFSLVKEHNLDFDANTKVRIISNQPDMPLIKCYEKPLTVKQMANYLWDLSAKPRQRAFQLLALNCEDELEKSKLLEFAAPEGLDDLINYINRPRRTILEVFQDFPHACKKLTLSIFIEIFSLIQPRSFSVASCMESQSLDLLVAVVEYKTIMSTPRLGLCSNWLKSLKKEDEIWATLTPSTMQLPKDFSTPIIMVGPGTGIAPFRSIIQDKIYATTTKLTSLSEKFVIFFGCRNRLKDFHFQSDLEAWSREGFITLFTAFSRDQQHKIYVQHLIKEKAKFLKSLIKQSNAYILVAGSSNNMPKAVKEAFLEILEEDEFYLEKLIKSKRYQEETW